ncbi:uncharacterized protein LOC144704522 [Wolffia australiana]
MRSCESVPIHLMDIKVEANGGEQQDYQSLRASIETDSILPEPARPDSLPSTTNGDVIPTQTTQSPLSNSPASSLKGHGLRRWRRVKRDVNKEDNNPGTDTSKILKRGLSIAEPAKIFNESNQTSKQPGPADLKSVPEEPFIQATEFDLFEVVASSLVGIQSEDSNEHSSESSVTPSISKSYREGFERDMDRGRNLRGKVLGGVAHSRAQRRKAGALQINKKTKGGQEIKSAKDNDSNFRSSGIILEESESICSNGMESPGIENHDEGIAGEDILKELSENHGEDDEETSRHDHQEEDVREENPSEGGKVDTNLHPDEDLFAEPLRLLHATQEALAKEVQMLEEISREESICPNDKEEDKANSDREMEELEALYIKSMEGEICCLLLSEAVEKERRAMREETAVLDRQLEKVTESCRRLQRVEELLGFHNGICKTSLYWIAQLGLLFLAMAALGLQVFFPPIDGGSDVPT